MSIPEVDATAYDGAHESVGVVMARSGDQVFLRPVGGGVEWTTRPEHLRAATAAEELSAKNAAVNRRSRGEVFHVPSGVPVPPCSRPCEFCQRDGRQ